MTAGATPETAPPRLGGTLSLVWLAVGLMTLLLTSRINAPALGDNQDPGPRFFPQVLGALLALGGIGQILAARRTARRLAALNDSRAGPQPPSVDAEPTTSAAPDTRSDAGERGDVGFLLAAVVLYVAALGYLGFSVSTLVLVVCLMRRLKAGWLGTVATALGLVTMVHLLFVSLFRVQLPLGRLGLPF